MRLNGYEIFSRQTIGSWRVAVGISSTLLTIGYFGYNNQDWPILSRPIPPHDFTVIATVLLVFLNFSHIINWYSDYLGYHRWFKNNKITKDEFWSGSEDTESPSESVRKKTQSISRSIKDLDLLLSEFQALDSEMLDKFRGDRDLATCFHKLSDSIGKAKSGIEGIENQIGDLGKVISDLGPNFDKVSTLAKAMLYIWYLVLPLSLSIFALASLWLPTFYP